MPLATINRGVPFSHRGHNGTQLESPRMDMLRCLVTLKRPRDINDAQFASDIAEIMGWWVINIYSAVIADGQGHSGFGTIDFEVILDL